MLKKLLPFSLMLGLGACINAPRIAEGRFLQITATDGTVLQEIVFATIGDCQFTLNVAAVNRLTNYRCTNASANLPYMRTSKLVLYGDVSASFQTLKDCQTDNKTGVLKETSITTCRTGK